MVRNYLDHWTKSDYWARFDKY